MWITSSPETALTPTVAALGNFDGIHLGHQQVIAPVLLPCLKESSDGKLSRVYSTVVSFSPHPVQFFSGKPVPTLSPGSEKIAQLEKLGVDQFVLVPFTQALASLSPREFVEEILVRRLQAQRVSVGEDFRFGYRRSGHAGDLKDLAADYGIEVILASLQTCQGERISSTAIRRALHDGDMDLATRMLGRPYSLIGCVIQGKHLGRTIGFPTANLDLPPTKLIPRQGVYGVRCRCPEVNEGEALLGVMNIGTRPTVNGTTETIEVHLLDWSGDLYGKTLTISLLQYIRSEQKFASLEALKAQIQADCLTARSLFSSVF